MGQHPAGDLGELELQRVLDGEPLESQQLPGVPCLSRHAVMADDEEPGVEPDRPDGRGNRARDVGKRVQSRRESGAEEPFPAARRRPPAIRIRSAYDQPGFFESLADRGHRHRTRARRAEPPLQPCRGPRGKRSRAAHPRIPGIDASAGKDEAVRHKPVPGVTLAHQHFENAGAFPVDDQRRGVARPREGIAGRADRRRGEPGTHRRSARRGMEAASAIAAGSPGNGLPIRNTPQDRATKRLDIPPRRRRRRRS